MSIKDWFEDALDNTIGKPARKALEQVGHFAIWPGGVGGIPGAAIALGIDAIPGLEVPIGAYIVAGIVTAMALATWREYNQNIGDEPDESTFHQLKVGDKILPINQDMVVDWVISSAGGLLAGVGFFFI